jgi:hypothetical protein
VRGGNEGARSGSWKGHRQRRRAVDRIGGGIAVKKAYIVLAHKHPRQLRRLLGALDDGSSAFFVHIDRNRVLHDFAGLAEMGEKVVMVKREHSQWARIGIVRAILNALALIDRRRGEFDRVILLSGQDYPIKSNRQVDEFLRQSPCSIFMDHWRIPNVEKWPHRGGLSRIDRYFMGLTAAQLAMARTANLAAKWVPVLRRRLPDGLEPFGGWMWWILDADAVRHIVEYVDRHPEYLAFHRHTFAPDEVFFQTILLNSTRAEQLQRICNDGLRYTDCQPSESHPRILTKADLPSLIASKDLFARKFDVEVDEQVLDLIDAALRTSDRSQAGGASGPSPPM